MDQSNDCNYVAANAYFNSKSKGYMNAKTGLPLMKWRTKESMSRFFYWYAVCGPALAALIAIAIGFGIHHWGETEEYEERIQLVKSYDMQWAFLGSFVLANTIVWMNMYPMRYKARV